MPGLHPKGMPNSRTLFPTRLTALFLQASLLHFFESNIPRYLPSHFHFEEQICFFYFGWLIFTPSYFHSGELLWLLTKVVAAPKEAWKTLFAERERKSVYRLSNNAWVICNGRNVAVNHSGCSPRGNHNLFIQLLSATDHLFCLVLF